MYVCMYVRMYVYIYILYIILTRHDQYVALPGQPVTDGAAAQKLLGANCGGV